MRNRITLILAILLVVAGCRERKAEQFQALPFPDVIAPGMITDYQDRADYSAEHFWDKFADTERSYPCDSVLVSGVRRSDVEGKFANWIGLLDMVSLQTACRSVEKLFDKAVQCERKDTASNVFETMNELVNKYLYDPNSPYRNEELYLPYVKRLAQCDLIEEIVRTRYSRETAMCSLNRIGTPAADFTFMDKNGRVRSLHGIRSEWTLLFFSNPGCEACMDIINFLRENQMVKTMIEEGSLAVVNVYIDEDIEGWRSYMPIYPDSWYNGFDHNMVIRNEVLYDVRAIPSLYILDKDKNVVMKDAPEPRAFSFLENVAQI